MEIIRYVTKKDMKKFENYDMYYRILGLVEHSLSRSEDEFVIPIKITIPKQKEVKK